MQLIKSITYLVIAKSQTKDPQVIGVFQELAQGEAQLPCLSLVVEGYFLEGRS
jgi:hypothetical protein